MNNHYTEKYPNCIQIASGVMFNLLDPKPDMFAIQDIAQCLSRIPRWNGSTKQFISIAEHSILVSKYLPQELQLTGLMHDCAEAYIGDISNPLKRIINGKTIEYKEGILHERGTESIGNIYGLIEEIEANILFEASRAFGFQYPLPDLVNQIDTQICETERVLLMPSGDWDCGCDPIRNIFIHCWEPKEAYIQFMCRFHNLKKGFKNGQN